MSEVRRNDDLRITAAEVGEEVTYRDGSVFTVVPACSGESSGEWRCVTHGEGFANQLQKDSHINRGAHCLAWVCHAHGVEVP